MVVPRSILRNALASTPVTPRVSTPVHFDPALTEDIPARTTSLPRGSSSSVECYLQQGTPSFIEDHSRTVLRKKDKKISTYCLYVT